jgi:hypothetical protein
MKKIITFWNYIKKNKQEILKAILLGINTNEILVQITRKVDYVSKRKRSIINALKSINGKITIIFIGSRYLKLFPKIIASENLAPSLIKLSAQAHKKTIEDNTKYQHDMDDSYSFEKYKLKISELQIALLAYNSETKQLIINIYLPNYNELKHLEDLNHNINWIIMQIIGEIAFRNHIKEIKLNQTILEQKGLLGIMELPYFMEYLFKINSKEKARIV